MLTKQKLTSLAKIDTDNLLLLSFYLNCDQTDEKQLKKSGIFLDNSLSEIESDISDAGAKDSFQEDRKKIKSEYETMLDSDKKGLVIFACSGKNIWETFRSPVGIENNYYYGDSAFLLPLVKVNEELTRTACVLLDSRKSFIYLITQGEVEKKIKEEHYFPDRIDAGGWSQMRFQRHVEKHLKDNFKEVYNTLKELSKEKPIDHLILGGPNELRKKFQDILDKRWQQKRVEGFSADSKIKDNELVQKVLDALEKEERGEEKNITKKIIESKAGRSSLENVLRAINRNKVRILAVAEDFSHSGYKCTESGLLYAGKQDCPGKGENLEEVDLEVEVIRRALLQDADVEVVSGDLEFKKQGGIGVIVRY